MTEFNVKQVKQYTQEVVYWMEKAARDLKQGDNAVYALTVAVNAAAKLGIWQSKDEDEELNYAEIFAEAVEKAKEEIAEDDAE